VIVSRSPTDRPIYCARHSLENPKSHVTDLLTLGVGREVNDEAVTTYLLDWDCWGDLFREIRVVPSGVDVCVGPGVARYTRQFPTPCSDTWLEDPIQDLVSQLRLRLLEAVQWAVAGARTVGILVGGTDSCGVLGALTQVISADRIRALNITGQPGDGETNPDIPYVEDLCRHLGVRLLRYVWSPKTSPVEDALITDNRPSYSPYMTEKRIWLEQLVESGAEVLLAATAGDSVFGGTFGELFYRAVHAPLASTRTFLGKLPWRVTPRVRAHWLLAAHVPLWRRRSSRPLSFYGPRLRKRLSDRTKRPVPKTPHERIVDWCISPNIITPDLYHHALTRGFSLNYRDVTLHPPLIQFLASVPIERLNCDGRFRGLYHRAIAPWVTRAVADRTSKSMHDPLVALEPSTRRSLRELARGQRLERLGYVDGRELLAWFDAGRCQMLWGFLTVEAWLRNCTS